MVNWAVSMLLAGAGCAAPAGPIQVAPAGYRLPGVPMAEQRRMGRVYVLRGFGDVFSAGMDTLTKTLQQQGVVATVHRHEQWQAIAEEILDADRQGQRGSHGRPGYGGPLILIGHSWGADDCIRIARQLSDKGIAVDLLITVEAVTPPAVPSNVLRAWNIYKPRPTDFLPWWRGVPLHADEPGKTRLTQIDISRDWRAIDHWWLGHTDVDNQSAVQDRIVSMVLETCPPGDLGKAGGDPVETGAGQTRMTKASAGKDVSDAR